MSTYRHIVDTRIATDFDLEVTITELDEGLAFDFYEEGLRERGSIDGVEVPYSVLADMARRYLRGENWIFGDLDVG
jgi:hypothetical protein